MLLKIIIISIAVIIVGEAAYFLFQPPSLSQNNPKNEAISDSVSAFMQNMSETLHWMNFSEIQETEMQWNVVKNGTTEKLTLIGKGFKAERVKDKDYRDIQDFFGKLHNGFEIDFFNTGSGSLIEYFGYKKRNDMVCTVASQIHSYEYVDYEEEEPTRQKTAREVVAKCAELPAP